MNQTQTIPASTYGHNSRYEEVNKGENQPDKFNDVFWGILFFFHLGMMVFAGVTYIPQLEADVRNQLASNYGYDYQNINAGGYYDYNYNKYNNYNDDNDNDDDANRKLIVDTMHLQDGFDNAQQSTITSHIMRAMGGMYLAISNQWNGRTIYSDERTLEENDYSSNDVSMKPNNVLLLVILTAVVAIIFSTLSLAIMIKFAQPLIKLSVLMNVVNGALMIIIGIMKERHELVVFGAIIFFVAGCYAYFVWGRIPFAATNLVSMLVCFRWNKMIIPLLYDNTRLNHHLLLLSITFGNN